MELGQVSSSPASPLRFLLHRYWWPATVPECCCLSFCLPSFPSSLSPFFFFFLSSSLPSILPLHLCLHFWLSPLFLFFSSVRFSELIFSFKNYTYLFTLSVCVPACSLVCLQHMCPGLRTTCGSWFSPFTEWVLGSKLRSLVIGQHLCLPAHSC